MLLIHLRLLCSSLLVLITVPKTQDSFKCSSSPTLVPLKPHLCMDMHGHFWVCHFQSLQLLVSLVPDMFPITPLFQSLGMVRLMEALTPLFFNQKQTWASEKEFGEKKTPWKTNMAFWATKKEKTRKVDKHGNFSICFHSSHFLHSLSSLLVHGTSELRTLQVIKSTLDAHNLFFSSWTINVSHVMDLLKVWPVMKGAKWLTFHCKVRVSLASSYLPLSGSSTWRVYICIITLCTERYLLRLSI